MKPGQMIQSFTDRFPYVGPIFWIVSVQYLIAQIVAAAAWATPFRLSQNVISDLGNTACGSYADRIVCSPLHSLMNCSFVALGVTMVVGSILIYREFREQPVSQVGFSMMAAAGIGTAVVGLFPENTVPSLHFLGALLPFLVGNVGLVVLGAVLDLPRSLKVYTIASGLVSLVALGLFEAHIYAGLGQGGMERLVAYPQTVWLIIFGIYISRNNLKQPSPH